MMMFRTQLFNAIFVIVVSVAFGDNERAARLRRKLTGGTGGSGGDDGGVAEGLLEDHPCIPPTSPILVGAFSNGATSPECNSPPYGAPMCCRVYGAPPAAFADGSPFFLVYDEENLYPHQQVRNNILGRNIDRSDRSHLI